MAGRGAWLRLRKGSRARKVVLFVAGLLLILLGGALVVLPGPLTIPPIVLGVWLWSLEFEWADRLAGPVRERGQHAWAQAKQKPVLTTIISVAGIAGAVAMVWAVQAYGLVDRGRELVGL